MDSFYPEKRKNGRQVRRQYYLFALILIVTAALLSDAVWIYLQQRDSQRIADGAALIYTYSLCVEDPNPRQHVEQNARDNGYGEQIKGIDLDLSYTHFKTEVERGIYVTVNLEYEIQTHFIGLLFADVLTDTAGAEANCAFPYINGSRIPPQILNPY